MTSTDSLPDHNGETVNKTQVKFSGVGTGFTGLDVNGHPIYMDLDEIGYFVIKARAVESPSARRDGHDELFWLNRLGAESIAPIDKATAEAALQAFAQKEEARKAAIDGQTSIDDELAAQEREARDGTDTPADIATDAADRIKSGR